MLTLSNLTINGIAAYPIWKDIVFSTQGTIFANTGTVDFDVIVNGSILFSGRATRRPGEPYVNIRLNDILAGLLRMGEPNVYQVSITLEGVLYTIPFYLFFGLYSSFQIRVTDPSGAVSGEAVEDGVVFADTSQDYNEDLDFNMVSAGPDGQFPEASRSALISRLADSRQFLLFSTLKGTKLRIFKSSWPTYYREVFQYTLPDERPRVFAIKASDLTPVLPNLANDFEYQIDWNDGNNNYILYLSQYPKGDDSNPDNFDPVPAIQVRDTCARYCLYYLNAKGGWDWLLIQGKAVESQNYNRSTIVRRASTDLIYEQLQRRETEVIQESLTRHLELHTHWLTDDEASRVWHLTSSPDVYVHNLETGIIHPAVLTGNSYTEKTYRKQGNKLVQYTIELDYAVEAQRR